VAGLPTTRYSASKGTPRTSGMGNSVPATPTPRRAR
jgi:hypothetical protein